MSARDDLQLVQRLLDHDGEAWRTFVERYERLVLARILATASECRVSLQRSDAEDLVADVLSALLANDMQSLRGFRGRSRLSTWLAVVARRIALKRLVRQRPVRLRDDTVAAGTTEVVDDLVAIEEAARLEEELDDLGHRDRALLRMIYEEGLSHREVARRLEVSPNSIGPLLQRARQRLRGRLLSDSDCYRAKLTPVD